MALEAIVSLRGQIDLKYVHWDIFVLSVFPKLGIQRKMNCCIYAHVS